MIRFDSSSYEYSHGKSGTNDGNSLEDDPLMFLDLRLPLRLLLGSGAPVVEFLISGGHRKLESRLASRFVRCVISIMIW